MKASLFIDLVRKMRSFQIAWYRHHNHSDLVSAKQFEKKVDDALSKGVEPDETAPALDFVTVQRPNVPEQKPLFTEGDNNE